ncbi:restriction endonuclease subunit S [Corallococcus exiguus]|uniref:restriction endonuclease subunit S n=1 Tax=Corallococcus exiguus TaxID=83462 RepID=UPI001470E02D|nr:restriction endonuclease subunit S [Corallococcus exiguus]NNC15538.1 restriction endonuclease subunit S [Corallococcus exiguus]
MVLGDLVTLQGGGTPPRDESRYWNGTIPWASVKDLGASRLGSTVECISPAGVEASATRVIKAGHVVVATRMAVGRASILEVDAAINQDLKALVPRPGRQVHPSYLLHLLGASTAFLERRATGATVKGIRSEVLESLPVPHANYDEQRRIADILDKADAIRCKRKQAIALTEELLRSTFLEMFGDPVTNSKEWPTETIDALCVRGAGLVDGPFGSSLKPEHYVDAGVKVVRNWNIYDDHFDFSEFKYVTPSKFEEVRRSEVLPGDVLITTKGTVGDVCVAPDLGGPAVLSASGTVRLRVPPDASFLPEFVVAQMTTPTYKRYLHTFEAGSAQQYLNLSAIRKMRLIRPPVEAQGAFRTLRLRVRHVHADAVVAHTESALLFSALVERAFSGGSSC